MRTNPRHFISSKRYTPPTPSKSWYQLTITGSLSNRAWMRSSVSGDNILCGQNESGLSSAYFSNNLGTSFTNLGSDYTIYNYKSSEIGTNYYSATTYYVKKSSNGTTWTDISPFSYNVRQYTDIATSSDGQILHLGTTTRLYTSTNGGTNWSEVQPAGNVDKTWNRVVCSSYGQIVIASNATRVYMSTNGGTDWAEIQPNGNIDRNWANISMSSDGSKILIAADNSTVYVSTNTGSSWSQISGFTTVWSVLVMPNGSKYYIGTSTKLYSSSNLTTWTDELATGATDSYYTDLASDGNTILASASVSGIGAKLYIYK